MMLGFVNSFWGSLWSYILHVFSLFSRFFVDKTMENWSESDDHDVKMEDFDQIEEKEIPKLNSEREKVISSSTSKYQFFAGNSVCSYIEEPQSTAMKFTVHEMFVIPNDGFNPKPNLVEKVETFSNDEIQGFSADKSVNSISHDRVIESPLVQITDFDEISRDIKNGKVENFGCDSSFDDHILVQNDCHDLLRREVEVVEEGKTEKSVFGSKCDDHQLVQNGCDGPSSGDDNMVVEQGEIVNHDCNFRCDVPNDDDLSEKEEVIKSRIAESPVGCDLNCGEKDVTSVIRDELSEKEEEETVSLDGILEKVEFSDQIHSPIANSDDFWSTIYKDDCVFGTHDEITVDYEEFCSNSLDDSSIDQSNVTSDDNSVESEHEDFDSSFIEIDPHTSAVHTEEHLVTDELLDLDECYRESSTLDKLKGNNSLESCDDEVDVQMGNDVLLEQKELIRQMKKEMRQLKVNGLPTILEESESPRVEEDLRPLRIDEKIGHKDRMDEIFIFHKRYLDKMRKLDILSQQTLYAIGLLKLKSRDQLALNKKVSVPMMKSLMAQNFWSHKLRKHETDTLHKLIRDLQRELELVYVGQLCLSWEILKWQYHRVEELQAHDPDSFRQYNQVAGELQKFQVLLQRFTEDEPFQQGPRVQHYLKTRCGHSNLLQVPLIKDDPRSEWRGDNEGAISISMLKEVVWSAMRSFWDFLHSDKDESHGVALMGIHAVHVELQDPSDTDLLTEIRSSLHKKEKRLKDVIRSGNCIVRKFHKHQVQRISPEMFLAQVELRLVSRVLIMSKLTTDQLLWCHKKMNKTNIIGEVAVDDNKEPKEIKPDETEEKEPEVKGVVHALDICRRSFYRRPDQGKEPEEEDIRLLEDHGVNAYRFSISWDKILQSI